MAYPKSMGRTTNFRTTATAFASGISLAVYVILGTISFGSTTNPGTELPRPVSVEPGISITAAVNQAKSKPPISTLSTPTQATAPAPEPPSESSPHPQFQYVALGLSPPATPLYSTQPFLSRIGATSAWQNFANTNAAPIIAVIDTGFALNHDALKNRWDSHKYDFVHNDSNPLAGKTNPQGSAVFHGTMTAGLAGILNPNATLMPLEALDDNGIGYTDGVAAAVRFAADNGANIISLSLGSNQDDPYLHQQIDYAISKGVVVVAAAGNDGCNCMVYPAAYPEVIAVGASDSANHRASFSSYGTNLDVLAPGTSGDVCSTFYASTNPTSAYSCSYSGTSFAAPIVAGLAALILQQDPSTSVSAMADIISRNAAKLTDMNGLTFTQQQGYGLISAPPSLLAVTIPSPAGQILNKGSASLSGNTLAIGASMDTTCFGIPGAACSVDAIGPLGQIIHIGQQVLDELGGADFAWDASTLGLTPGNWVITSTMSSSGQTTTLSQTLQIRP
jgi:hypothetical protein